MVKILILLISVLFSWVSPSRIETPIHVSCIALIENYGPYAYPSVYVTQLPADLEIVFTDAITSYRFQGLNDYAVRAVLPSGNYWVSVFHGKEQVSKTYLFEIKSDITLSLVGVINVECLPERVPAKLNTA